MSGDYGSSGGGASSKRMQQTQAQVDEVVGIMKVNVEKVRRRNTTAWTQLHLGLLARTSLGEGE